MIVGCGNFYIAKLHFPGVKMTSSERLCTSLFIYSLSFSPVFNVNNDCVLLCSHDTSPDTISSALLAEGGSKWSAEMLLPAPVNRYKIMAFVRNLS